MVRWKVGDDGPLESGGQWWDGGRLESGRSVLDPHVVGVGDWCKNSQCTGDSGPWESGLCETVILGS